MLNKVKNIISKTDNFLFKKFGSNKGTKFLENIKEAQIIFTSLNAINEEINLKFVGGCVRKSLSGLAIDDIDLATTLHPNEVKKKLANMNIQSIDTGISHGTITAIINKKKFEITTLRKDISTDGRHAKVEFTLNWKEDSLRRDFSINSIYVDSEGRIYDPQNGVADLKNGRVKFIGAPEERIQEDYLRILRYFRFFTEYSKFDHEKDVILSIKKNINGINKISNERIFDELKKILKLDNLWNLFSDKKSKEIILTIFPQFKYYKRVKIIKNLKIKYEYHLMLAALLIDQSNEHEYFCHKYKTSNKLKEKLGFISKNYKNLKNKNFYFEKNIKKLIYIHGKDKVRDLLFFSLCLSKKIDVAEIEKLIDFTKSYKVPRFPISGDALKVYGYETGKLLGKKLKLLEEKWIENNFVIKENFIEKYLGKVKEN